MLTLVLAGLGSLFTGFALGCLFMRIAVVDPSPTLDRVIKDLLAAFLATNEDITGARLTIARRLSTTSEAEGRTAVGPNPRQARRPEVIGKPAPPRPGVSLVHKAPETE